MASPNIKPGYQRGVRGGHRTGWLSRRNYKKQTEMEKELGRSGVCREYKTRTEESRIIKKLIAWSYSRRTSLGSGQRVGCQESQEGELSRWIQDKVWLATAGGFEHALQLWLPSVHNETPSLKVAVSPFFYMTLLLGTHTFLTGNSQIQDVQIRSMGKSFPWLPAHRWNVWTLLSLPGSGNTWLLPSPQLTSTMAEIMKKNLG